MKIIKKSLLIVLLISFSFVHAEKIREISKIHCHSGGLLHDKIVLSVKDPICNYLPNKDGALSENGIANISLFMPMTKLNKRARSMLAVMHEKQKKGYEIFCQEENLPLKGMKCDIKFNPKEVGFEYSYYNEGIALTFHDRSILKKIGEKGFPIRRQVDVAKKSVVIDCGHGGSDPGCGVNGVLEKDISLAVGKKLALALKKKVIR